MNNDKNHLDANNATFNADERRGLNENANYENARNKYQNNEPVQEKPNEAGVMSPSDVKGNDTVSLEKDDSEKTSE